MWLAKAMRSTYFALQSSAPLNSGGKAITLLTWLGKSLRPVAMMTSGRVATAASVTENSKLACLLVCLLLGASATTYGATGNSAVWVIHNQHSTAHCADMIMVVEITRSIPIPVSGSISGTGLAQANTIGSRAMLSNISGFNRLPAYSAKHT